MGQLALTMFHGPLNDSLTRWTEAILVHGSDCEGIGSEGSQTSHIGLARVTINIYGPGCLSCHTLQSDIVACDEWDVIRWLHPVNEDCEWGSRNGHIERTLLHNCEMAEEMM